MTLRLLSAFPLKFFCWAQTSEIRAGKKEEEKLRITTVTSKGNESRIERVNNNKVEEL